MNQTLARLLPIALLLAPLPARAQERIVSSGETRMVEQHDGYRMEVRSRGRVEFDDEGEWVVEMAPGAELTVREDTSGRDRRIDFHREGGGVRAEYRENGGERPLDAAAREWARGVLRQATRESGLGAAARVARIRRRSGVAGVLADMAGIRSDTGRRLYYLALLGSGPMSDGDFARVMDDVGARMHSDTETRLVLGDAAGRAQGGRGLQALLRAAAGIESDTEARLVLSQVAERHRLTDPGARDAFFRVVEGLGSNTERRLVLGAVLERNTLDDAGMQAAFFHAARGIGSDTERRLVLSRALDRGSSDAVAVGALRAMEGMRSDTEKRLVLTNVSTSLRRSPRVVDAYRQVVGTIRSDTERRLALTWLLDGGR